MLRTLVSRALPLAPNSLCTTQGGCDPCKGAIVGKNNAAFSSDEAQLLSERADWLVMAAALLAVRSSAKARISLRKKPLGDVGTVALALACEH